MNKKIFLTVLMIFTAAACAENVEVSLADGMPPQAYLNAGTSINLDIVIKNNQDNSQELEIYTAGVDESWISVKESSTISAQSEETVTMVIAPPVSALGGDYIVTLTASSPGADDMERWDMIDIPVTVIQKESMMHGVHELVTLEQKSSGTTLVKAADARMHLNAFFEPTIHNLNFNLKDGDECCVGDTLSAKANPSADYAGDGGPIDEPPVTFVADLDAVINEINMGTYTGKPVKTAVCNYPPMCRTNTEPAKNLPGQECECFRDIEVICESNCEVENSGETLDTGRGDGTFYITGDGQIEVNIECMTECIAYNAFGTYEKLNIASTGKPWYSFDTGSTRMMVSEKFILNAVSDERKPELKIDGYTYNEVEGKTLILIKIVNTGDALAYLDDIKLSSAGEILYAPAEVDPGKTGEIIVEAGALNTRGLKADVSYSTEKTGCLKDKYFSGTYPIGACASDSDCDDGNYATDDYCNRPGTPESQCMNMKLKTLNFINSTQTYRMDVEGTCKNEYFTCYSPDRDSRLSAGHKCFNTENKYFTNAEGRFNLKFDLSILPPEMDIKVARLYLTAEKVNKPQDIRIYSVSNDWSAEYCEPGGDICTQPYCGECKQAHDLEGTQVASTYIEDSGAASFDITDYIREEYRKGTTQVSLQVRGVEKKDLCDELSAWKNHDVEFSGSDDSKLYIKILKE